MSDDDKKLAPLSDLNLQRVFRQSVDDMSNKEAADSWALIDAIESVIKERKSELRASLLKRAEAFGEERGNGFVSDLDGVTVIKEKRVAKLPNAELVETLAKEAGLEYDDVFTPKREWALDPSKLEFLIKGGKLPADKLEASKKVTWALKVKPKASLHKRLDEVKKQLTPPSG